MRLLGLAVLQEILSLSSFVGRFSLKWHWQTFFNLLRLFWSLEAEDSCLFLLLLFLLDFLLVLLSWSLAGEECENTS